MGHTNTHMEDIDAEGDLNCGGLAEEVSEEKNGLFWVVAQCPNLDLENLL